MTNTLKRSYAICLLALGLLMGAGPLAHAQSIPGWNLLTEAEQKAFHERLSDAYSTGARAKIRAEINRLIQERKMQKRQKMEQHKDASNR